MFRRLHLDYFRPFWPRSRESIFIIFCHFGHIKETAIFFYYLWPFWPCSSGYICFRRCGHVQAAAFFIIVGHFGHVQAAALLLFLAVLAVLRRLHFYNLPQFWPCLRDCTFIIFRSVGHVQVAAIALFAAVLAIFRGCIFIMYRPCWPC